MSSKPTFIRFHLEHNDDEEITCFCCSLPRCEQFFEVSGGNVRRWVGVHSTCVDKHMSKLTQTRSARDSSAPVG